MTKLFISLCLALSLAACANADGSRPRYASSVGGTSPAGFDGGYAGTHGGFSNLNTKSVPF